MPLVFRDGLALHGVLRLGAALALCTHNSGLPGHHSESSQANKSASRFQRGGFVGRSLESTCSRAFRFVSRSARTWPSTATSRLVQSCKVPSEGVEGLTQQKLGKHEDAIKSFRKVLEKDLLN